MIYDLTKTGTRLINSNINSCAIVGTILNTIGAICFFIAVFCTIPLSFAMQNSTSIDGEYNKLVSVSNKFLDGEKDKFISENTSNKLVRFAEQYESQESSIIDLTGLSSRSRIYILRKLIDYKLEKLYSELINQDDIWSSSNSQFKAFEFNMSDWWEKKNGDYAFKDLFPTTLKVGNYEYDLTLGPTFNQRGNGLLSKMGTYVNISKKIKQMKIENLPRYSWYLLEQKKDGQPIESNDGEEINGFLNGFNLLLRVLQKNLQKTVFQN